MRCDVIIVINFPGENTLDPKKANAAGAGVGCFWDKKLFPDGHFLLHLPSSTHQHKSSNIRIGCAIRRKKKGGKSHSSGCAPTSPCQLPFVGGKQIAKVDKCIIACEQNAIILLNSHFSWLTYLDLSGWKPKTEQRVCVSLCVYVGVLFIE